MRNILRFFALFAILLAAPASAATMFSQLVVFGDSLIDSGNASIATGGAEAPAADGYYFGRFSNGPNFADYVSASLFGTPATPALLGGTNFAVGGATAQFIPGAASPSFLEQIGLYTSYIGPAIPNDALVLLTFGGNDVRQTIGTAGAVDFTGATNDLLTGLNVLYGYGARNFVVTGSPDIGQLPSSIADAGMIPGRLGELTDRSEEISALFAGASSAFASSTGAGVTFFDLFSLDQAVRVNPLAYGLPSDLNTTDPCQILGAGVPQIANCAGSLYFDQIHPTTMIHQVIAGAVLAQLNGAPQAVPEPATWLLLLAGFGFVGVTLRTRRRMVPLAAA